MQYIDVTQKEAEDKKGNLNPGYEKWAYSWKKVIPDTAEEVKAKALTAAVIPKAREELATLKATQDADKSKVTLTDLITRIQKIETILGL